MTAISDAQLVRAGLLSDMVLGFRAAMRGRTAKEPAAVVMPEHLRDERNLPRRLEFQHGARIGLTWRRMRNGSATARRESRNAQFRDQGIAYCIDPAEVRSEAWSFLLAAVAQAEHFGRPDPGLVDEIATAVDHGRDLWEMATAVRYYSSEGPNGILSPIARTSLRAMGERGWTSLEAVYQAQKFPCDLALQDAIRTAPDGRAAKAIATGHRSTRRRDWHGRRVTAMVRATVLRAEQDGAYRTFLLSLAGRDIVEDTVAGEHHRFWGVVDGRGANVAGQIAMLVRDRIIAADRRISLE
jgi:predicted NAD-dependent protein-ADP-ribosyltransferase YbiA (DUF1768 family)